MILVYPFSGKPKCFMNPKSLTCPNKKYSFINEKWHIQPATLEIRVFLVLLLSHTQPHNPGMIQCVGHKPHVPPVDDEKKKNTTVLDVVFYVRGWPVHNVHNGFTRVRFLALNHWFNENKAVCVCFLQSLDSTSEFNQSSWLAKEAARLDGHWLVLMW